MNINRRKEILNLLLQHGSVKVSVLAERFAVNDVTIRRDLKYLAEKHGVTLTYGGAFIDTPSSTYPIAELTLAAKRRQQYEEKQIIARKAAALIENGDTIALNAGSTVEYVLDYLPSAVQRLNVLTLSLGVAVKASSLPQATLFLPGGKVRPESTEMCGSETERFLRQFNVDKVFFGAAAVHLKRGVTHPVPEEVTTNRLILDIAAKRYLVCDSSKFDGVSLQHIADLSFFDAIIADDKLPESYRTYCQLNGITIL